MKIDQSNIGLGILAFLLGAIVTLTGMTLFKQTQPAPIVIMPPEPTPTVTPTATPGPIQVYVNGAVAEEAIYTLPPGSLWQDAIEAAGGFLAGANTTVVNLAQPLFNGAQVYVPYLAEDAATPTAVVAGSAPSANHQGTQTAAAAVGTVNINTADSAQLETLPGIGPSTAEKIIAFRNENGRFTTIEDIMNVPGIGEGKFDQIRDLITVQEN